MNKALFRSIFSVVIVALLFIQCQDESTIEESNYTFVSNLFYKDKAGLSNYEMERCYLDLYIPKESENFPVLIWF